MMFFAFIKRHKILTIILSTVILVLLSVCITLQVLSPYYAVGCTFFTSDAADTISIAFDKPEMMKVNKAEIETHNGITVIEDKDLIKEIVDCTLVATHSGIPISNSSCFIRLYTDDVLIRNMSISFYHNTIQVYNQDDKHYFLYHSKESGGQVYIPEKLLEKLEQYLLDHGNGFDFLGG